MSATENGVGEETAMLAAGMAGTMWTAGAQDRRLVQRRPRPIEYAYNAFERPRSVHR